MRNFRWIVGFILLLTACTPTDDAIPTLFELPTESPTSPAEESVFDDLPPTFTPTNTDAPSLTPTLTDAPPPTVIPTIAVTPSETITNTPSPTGTPLPPLPTIDPADRPRLGILEIALRTTILPDDYQVPDFQGIEVTFSAPPTGIPPLEAITITPPTGSTTTVACTIPPAGGFGIAYTGYPNVTNQLGCAFGNVQDVPAAWQNFQQGVMIWLNGEMIVLYNTGQIQIYPDTFVEGIDPQASNETPPQGLFTPIRGFLKVWSSNPQVRNGLGWALNQEQGVTAKVQSFQNGRMIYLPGRGDILILLPNNIWQGVAGSF